MILGERKILRCFDGSWGVSWDICGSLGPWELFVGLRGSCVFSSNSSPSLILHKLEKPVITHLKLMMKGWALLSSTLFSAIVCSTFTKNMRMVVILVIVFSLSPLSVSKKKAKTKENCFVSFPSLPLLD